MPTWIASRPHLFFSLLIGIVAYVALANWLNSPPTIRLLMAWNLGAILYLLAAIRMMFSTSEQGIRQRALAQDEGQRVILTLVVVSALMCLSAVLVELRVAKTLMGSDRYEHMAHTVLTILSSWLFTQVMFAQHYAHCYYFSLENSEPPGLLFPGENLPDYLDFLYLSCIIGTSAQTADVIFNGKSMRRIGLLHCILSYFFNTIVLALTINLASSLI